MTSKREHTLNCPNFNLKVSTRLEIEITTQTSREKQVWPLSTIWPKNCSILPERASSLLSQTVMTVLEEASLSNKQHRVSLVPSMDLLLGSLIKHNNMGRRLISTEGTNQQLEVWQRPRLKLEATALESTSPPSDYPWDQRSASIYQEYRDDWIRN
jgi:hypothetical protein